MTHTEIIFWGLCPSLFIVLLVFCLDKIKTLNSQLIDLQRALDVRQPPLKEYTARSRYTLTKIISDLKRQRNSKPYRYVYESTVSDVLNFELSFKNKREAIEFLKQEIAKYRLKTL